MTGAWGKHRHSAATFTIRRSLQSDAPRLKDILCNLVLPNTAQTEEIPSQSGNAALCSSHEQHIPGVDTASAVREEGDGLATADPGAVNVVPQDRRGGVEQHRRRGIG